MPHLDRIHPFLADTLWTEEGHLFKGAISQIQNKDVAASKKFIHSRRRLFVGKSTDFVVPGTVFRNGEHRWFLAADDGEGFYQGTLYRQFRLVELEKQLEHTRRGTVVDTVTGLKREGQPQSLGMVRCAVEPRSGEEDQIRIEVNRFNVITGAVLLPNDLVGPYVVSDVIERLGIYIATVTSGS